MYILYTCVCVVIFITNIIRIHIRGKLFITPFNFISCKFISPALQTYSMNLSNISKPARKSQVNYAHTIKWHIINKKSSSVLKLDVNITHCYVDVSVPINDHVFWFKVTIHSSPIRYDTQFTWPVLQMLHTNTNLIPSTSINN